MIFQDTFVQVGGEITDVKASPSHVEEDWIHCGEDVDKLAGTGHVRLHEGLRRIITFCPLQSHQVPGVYIVCVYPLSALHYISHVIPVGVAAVCRNLQITFMSFRKYFLSLFNPLRELLYLPFKCNKIFIDTTKHCRRSKIIYLRF